MALGSHVQGLRVPNSGIDGKHSGGRIGDRYFRGSGTSQSTAIVSGAVALILQKYPIAHARHGQELPQVERGYQPGRRDRAQGKGEIASAPLLSKAPATPPRSSRPEGTASSTSREAPTA